MKSKTKKISILFTFILLLFISIPLFSACDANTETCEVTFMNVAYIGETPFFTENETITIDKGDVIGSAPVSTNKFGYTFAGWYTEKECINQWHLYTDIVKSDLTLYPKYVRN